MEKSTTDVSQGSVLRQELFDVWHNEANKENAIRGMYSYLIKKLELRNYQDVISDDLKRKCDSIDKQIRRKWRECHCSTQNFLHKYSKWVDGYFIFDDIIEKVKNTPTTSGTSGRPRKPFSESSDQTKRRKVQPLLKSSTEELAFATQMSLRAQGQRTAAEIVKSVSESSEKASDIKKATTGVVKKPVKLTADEALASYVQNRLTKAQYIAIHKETKRQHADIYPSYDDILSAKKRCYPEEIEITEVSAEIKLQSIIDHTIRRLMLVQKEVVCQVTEGDRFPRKVTAIYKWGCDGASGHQKYKQRFTESEHTRYDDTFLFVVSCVPLQLIGENESILWQNQRPSSTAFCRPIKICFVKESEQLVKHEVSKIKEQIEHLIPTEVTLDDIVFSVEHKLSLTMVDGKICGYLTETPSSNCYICNATPKEMNDLNSHSKRNITLSALSFGMSSLHAWIKFFECVLHISYKLDIKRWKSRNEDKDIIATRKKLIQDRLREQMGLLVDIPKPGFGTTNDGNTARRFFADPDLASQITGIDKMLIYRLSVILRTIACGLPVNPTKFEEYTLETAKLYISLYNWYFMPPSVHKILIHGSAIISSAIVPIGQLSEEAQEARHKDCKRFRHDSTRKMSRKSTMEDLIHMLLITSDPLISTLIHKPSKKSGPLPADVLNMLDCSYDAQEMETDIDSDSDIDN